MSRYRNRDYARMQVVDVDIGGTIFRTPEATLRKLPLFKALLECEGPLFVDRCPRLFERVLELVRTGQVILAGDRAGKHWAELARIKRLARS